METKPTAPKEEEKIPKDVKNPIQLKKPKHHPTSPPKNYGTLQP